MVVFPTRDREASGTQAGDMINVTLEHDGGYREVDVPASLAQALTANGVKETFYNLNYSTRKAYVRQIIDAKSDETIQRRINRIVSVLKDV